MRTTKFWLLGIIIICCGFSGLKAQSLTDIDGNVYKILTIGTQTWMQENLKTTKLNDGTAILATNKANFWKPEPSYCWSNFDVANKLKYGALYSGYTVQTSKLCPIGWHVPSKSEWEKLIKCIDPEYDPNSIMKYNRAAIKMKTTQGWEFANIATNESEFSALPGGYRNYVDFGGIFLELLYEAKWWCSTMDELGIDLYYAGMSSTSDGVVISAENRQKGFSVRCVRD